MQDTSLNERNISTLVNSFYARVRQDDLLGPVFNNAIGDRWPEHLAKLTDFWCSVLLASGRYKGNPMMAHLAIPQMDTQHLGRWLELWRYTTADVFVAEIAATLVDRATFIGERLVAFSTRARAVQLAV